MTKISATVSGSFRRHMTAVQVAVQDLADAGVTVLSPSDPRVVDAFGDFVFVASDRQRVVRTVQSRHLVAIERSDLLWLVTPDGYVGPSAAMELGFAIRAGVPVFSDTPPADLTMRQFVIVVASIQDAIQRLSSDLSKATHTGAVLLHPEQALASAHDHLESIAAALCLPDPRHLETAPALHAAARAVRESLTGL